MRVFVLTYCRNVDLLGGTTLLFRTLRTGFPTAEIHVADNCSVAEARAPIAALAAETGCRFSQFEKVVAHHGFIEYVLSKYDGTVVFVDPDVIFWERCEDWRSHALVAGRLIPRFKDEFAGAVTAARLHTSFLWVPDSERLRSAVAEIRRSIWDFEPFRPYAFKDEGTWVRFDCGASLYAALGAQCQAFGEQQLDSYDHLFVGSHVDQVLPRLAVDDARELAAVHAQARLDPAPLRGLWRRQQQYFERRIAEDRPPRPRGA